MSFEKLLNKLCVIQKKSGTQNATGSVTTSWADTYVNIPCRYNRQSQGKGSMTAGVFQVTLEDYVFYFKIGTVITIADRISIDGKYFEVQHVYTDGSVHHLEVFAREKSFE